MKEKRTKKESNKEEAKKECTEVLVFAASKSASHREDLKIDWPALVRFFNDTLRRLGISFYRIDLRALDKAYSVAFPKSTAINVSKKSSKV